MSDISCRAFEFFEVHAAEYGYSLEELVAETDQPLSFFQNRKNRVPWEVWGPMVDRWEGMVGGPEVSRSSGPSAMDMDFIAPVRGFAATIVSPSAVYPPMIRFLGPYLFRSFEWHGEVVSETRVSMTITLPEHQTVSPAWFRIVEGAMRSVPMVLGAAPAEVELRVEGQTAYYDIVCPPSLTFWSRIRRRVRRIVRAPAMLRELEGLQVDLQEAYGQVAASERELRRALDGLADPVALLSAGELQWANSRWLAEVGNLVPDELRADPAPSEIEIVDPGGQRRIYQVPAPVPIHQHGAGAEQQMLREVTAIREAAERGRVADRLAALGTLAASVGHEINNPLAYAMSHLRLLKEQLDELPAEVADPMRADLSMVSDGLNRVAAITHDLQTISRESKDTEVVAIDEVVAAAMRLASSEVRAVATHQLVVEPDLPPVWGNAARLTQVVLNLVVNAAHAMAERPADDHTLRVVAMARGEWLLISVQDTGPGVPPELRQRVFEPFFTTKQNGQGTGLGLSVCRRIVEDHGGRLELFSGRTGGTHMTIHLPVGSAPQTANEPTQAQPNRPLRVLFVDDEVPLLAATRRLLRPHQVTTVSDTSELAPLLEQEWDAIVLDVAMRGEDGPTLYGRLAPHHQERVLFVTGGVFQASARAQLDAIDRPLIAKPFTKESLITAIWSVAPRPGPSGPETQSSQRSSSS